MANIEVLKNLWSEGDVRVSGAKFTEPDGSTRVRLMLQGVDVATTADIAMFKRSIARVVKLVTPLAPAATARQLWVTLARAPQLAEQLDFDADELTALGLSQLALLDVRGGRTIRVSDGTPHAQRMLRYDWLREGPPLVSAMGAVLVPPRFKRLAGRDLNDAQNAIVDEVLRRDAEALRYALVIFDDQPRLLAVFRSTSPARATSVRVNLQTLATEPLARVTELLVGLR